MKIVNSVLATVLAVSSLLVVFLTSMFILYGFKILGVVFEVILLDGEINPESFHLETTFWRGLGAFIFSASAYHVIFRLSLHYIQASAMKVAAAVIVFFFLFSNTPAEVLQMFNASLLSWLIYLLSLGILGMHLWSRKEELELEKVSEYLKAKGIRKS